MIRRGPREGFLLVGVLWLVTLISALVLAAQMGFRSFAAVATVSRDRAVAEALLVAGLEFAAGLAPAVTAPVDTGLTLDTGTVGVRLLDEAGRIDLNRAPLPLLAALMRAAGAAPGSAEALAARIADWRDPDDVRADGGAEALDYEAAGVPARPANAPFTDVRQLRFVLGVTPAVAEAALALATVDGRAGIDPLTAPPEVLAILPGLDPGRLETILRWRREGRADERTIMALLGPAAALAQPSRPRAFSVRLEARTARGTTVQAQATIVLLTGDRQPYRVIRWRRLS